jgi:hypothetical protein
MLTKLIYDITTVYDFKVCSTLTRIVLSVVGTVEKLGNVVIPVGTSYAMTEAVSRAMKKILFEKELST